MITATKQFFRPLTRHPLFWQVVRFGIVGVCAACVNFFAVVLLVQAVHFTPLVANVFAFTVAFQVSFFGHKCWTFKHKGSHLPAVTKFLLVALASLLLSEALFALFLKEIHFYYPIALLLTLILVPPATFTINKLWTFRA